MSIVPGLIQGEYRYVRDPETGELTTTPNDDVKMLDAACMAVPWLFFVGFILTFSALFAKIWRVRIILNHSSSLRRTVVHAKDVAPVMVGFMFVEILILLLWQLLDPLKWARSVLTKNEQGYPLQSVGHCTSDSAVPFVASLAIYNIGILIYALYLCFVTRNTPSELNEGRWITISIISIFQILLLAIPVLILSWRDSSAFFFVRSTVGFLLSFGVTCFVFIPKARQLHFPAKEALLPQSRRATSAISDLSGLRPVGSQGTASSPSQQYD